MAKVTDEQLLTALLSCGSIRRAASAAGVSAKTIRTRLENPVFRNRYETTKAEILKEACDSLAARLTAASDTLSDIMENEENPVTVRTSAADALLRHGLRYIEAGNILARLDALEQAQREGGNI